MAADTGRLELSIVEQGPEGNDVGVAARVHLVDPQGKPLSDKLARPGLPFWKDHFNCDGTVALDLVPGEHIYTIERGPEYRRAEGSVTITAGKTTKRRVKIERWIDMKSLGWWSGETHVHRPLEDVPLLMRSEDLHVAPVLTVWNKQNSWRGRDVPKQLVRRVGPGAGGPSERLYHVLGIEDERRGGALFFLNATAPIEMRDNGREFPSPIVNLEKALKLDAWIDIEKPFWWDVPTWVATGEIDSIGLANNHMCRSSMYANEAWGRPRDAKRLPPPRGNGFHTQEIYYHLLNCGIRIPPSAGSASGVLPNPVGYNRVYVHLDGKLTWDAWWKGLAAGRSFVTNGPMLFVKANGKLPGEIFRADAGGRIEIVIDVRVSGNDALEAIEVIRDGRVSKALDVAGKSSTKLVFEKSGWFLVRAITDVKNTFRFASTAPFYVEVGEARRTVHRSDVDYFRTWIDERISVLERDAQGWLAKPEQKKAVLAPHRRAKRFFDRLLESAR
jgi:hypothetical protein